MFSKIIEKLKNFYNYFFTIADSPELSELSQIITHCGESSESYGEYNKYM